MIGADGKKITPVYGNMRPVEVRVNNQRIAGWVEEFKSGESVEFENTYNHEAEVLVHGKSEQVQTVQGKNLFNDNKILDLSNYETISPYDYLKLDVKPLTFYTIKLRDDFNLEVLPLPSAGNYAFRINNAKEMDATKTVINIRSSGIRESRTITLQSSSEGELYIILYQFTQPRLDLIRNAMQLEEGSTATPYEPFVPDSPSPDYPSPVLSAEGNLVSRGKNLADSNLFEVGKTLFGSGVGAQVVPTSGYPARATIVTQIKPDTNYTVSVNGPFYLRRITTFADANYVALQDSASSSTTRQTYSLVSDSEAKLIGVSISTDDESDMSLVFDQVQFQIEEGSTPTPYDRFRGYTTIPLPPLRRIDDIADTYNPETGEYVQRIGKKVFDGTEDFSVYAYATNNGFLGFISRDDHFLQGAVSRSEGLSSHFNVYPAGIGLYTSQTAEGVGTSTLDPGTMVIRILPNRLSTPDVNGLKAFLAAQHAAGTPVTVYYQLAEPVTTYLEPAQVPTYYPYTRLEQDGAVKGTIDATVKVME